MHNQTDSCEATSNKVRKRCIVHYSAAAIVGAVVWGMLGISFGNWLFGYSLSWDDLTSSQILAEIAWTILVLPAEVFIPPSVEPFGRVQLGVMYSLNGIVWGLAILFVYRKATTLLRRLRHGSGKGAP